MEKRKLERFDLQIETMLNVRDEARTESLPVLFSRDISHTGVFLVTDNPLPIGTSLDLNLLFSQHELDSNSKDVRIQIIASGEVIRTDDQGMAVEFDNIYKVSPLKNQP